jgi:type I restriction enzyme, S subunit
MQDSQPTIPDGYRQTDVGIIPKDWELKEIGDVCKVNQGLQIAIEHRLKMPTQKSKTYITLQFLNNAKEIEYIDAFTQSVCCGEEDVLMTRTGNTGMVVTGVNGVFHNNFFKINFNRKILNKDYFVEYLNTEKIQHLILVKAGTSTIPDLNHKDFYSIPIILPPLPEQQAIAEVLSDVDALVTSLDRLIAKKRNIKQGTMQLLLTGKKRLTGFSGDWETKKLGDIGECIIGLTYSPENVRESGLLVLRSSNIQRNRLTTIMFS